MRYLARRLALRMSIIVLLLFVPRADYRCGDVRLSQ